MLDTPQQRIRARHACHRDLHEIVKLVPAWLPLSAAEREALPKLWTRILWHPGFNADVIEDLDRPEGERIVGLGMALVLTPTWQEKLRNAPPAFAAARLYQELADGTYVLPDDRALANMNATGEISFMVLHYAQITTDLADPYTLKLLAVAMGMFRHAHSGFRLRELYQEGIGDECAYLASMGFRQKTQRGVTSDGLQPELFGLSRDEAATMLPGTPVRDCFQYMPPTIGFSPAERRLLRLAINDVSDDEIGDELGITAHTIKKLWRSIYTRCGDRAPSVFEDDATAASQGTRGPEKKRVLLNYLRHHIEELRPYAA